MTTLKNTFITASIAAFVILSLTVSAEARPSGKSSIAHRTPARAVVTLKAAAPDSAAPVNRVATPNLGWKRFLGGSTPSIASGR